MFDLSFMASARVVHESKFGILKELLSLRDFLDFEVFRTQHALNKVPKRGILLCNIQDDKVDQQRDPSVPHLTQKMKCKW